VQQRLERPESKHIVQNLDNERFALAQTERRALLREQFEEQRPDFSLGARAVGLGERLQFNRFSSFRWMPARSCRYC
jgi:hypothetical protein